MQRSFFEQITLTRFRSYEHLRLEADHRPVILTGENGAGKTNFLEALSLLSPGRGLRRAPSDSFQKQGTTNGWGISALLKTGAIETHLGTGQTLSLKRRAVKIDHEPASTQAALATHVSILWLTPQMDRLFLEGSEARRRFLDRLVFAFDPSHAGRLSRYKKTLRERLRLLQDHQTPDPAWLDALEEKLSQTAISIAASRRDMVARLRRFTEQTTGTFPRPILKITGLVEDWLTDKPALAIEARLQEMLKNNRSHDAQIGQTKYGIHRSDLEVIHADKNQSAAQCSTGEQKALLMSLILAHARMSVAEHGRTPVLLLDEVAAHLDNKRREALFEEILSLKCQSWITGTDSFLFQSLRDNAQYYTVHQGGMTPT